MLFQALFEGSSPFCEYSMVLASPQSLAYRDLHVVLVQCHKEDIWKGVVGPTFWVMSGEMERGQASHGPCLSDVILIWCRKSSVDKRMGSYRLGIRDLSD